MSSSSAPAPAPAPAPPSSGAAGDSGGGGGFPCRVERRVLYLTAAHAQLAAAALGVDEELQRDRARRALRAEGRELVAELSAADARLLRITASSFTDMLAAQLRAMRDFA